MAETLGHCVLPESRTEIDGRRAGLLGDLALSCGTKARVVLTLPSSCFHLIPGMPMSQFLLGG